MSIREHFHNSQTEKLLRLIRSWSAQMVGLNERLAEFFFPTLFLHVSRTGCISVTSTAPAALVCIALSTCGTCSNLLPPSAGILDAWREQIVEELQEGFASFCSFSSTRAQSAIRAENRILGSCTISKRLQRTLWIPHTLFITCCQSRGRFA